MRDTSLMHWCSETDSFRRESPGALLLWEVLALVIRHLVNYVRAIEGVVKCVRAVKGVVRQCHAMVAILPWSCSGVPSRGPHIWNSRVS